MAVIEEQGFINFVLQEMPLPVAIADSKVTVQAINLAAQDFFCLSNKMAHLRKCGEVLKCVNSLLPGGCGAQPACTKCVLRNSVIMALEGKSVVRNKGAFHVYKSKDIVRLNLLITASPTIYNNEQMIIILIEDVSLITQLQGLLPICSNCYKIRDESGQWVRLEEFIRERSEADFTHDYCPECINNALKNNRL